MRDKPERERHDAESAFDADAFQVRRERFFGAMSLTFAGILYTALITVVGVVVAIIPVHQWLRVGSVVLYVLFCCSLFLWGVEKGRGVVIAFSRKLLRLPPSGG